MKCDCGMEWNTDKYGENCPMCNQRPTRPSLLGVRGKNYKVMADHPILARPDKSNLSESDARAYADSLRPLGFKNISVIYIAPNDYEITG